MYKLYNGNDMLSTGPKYTEETGTKNIQPDSKPDCTLYNHQKEIKTGLGWDKHYNTDHQSSIKALTDITTTLKTTRYILHTTLQTLYLTNRELTLFSTYLTPPRWLRRARTVTGLRRAP